MQKLSFKQQIENHIIGYSTLLCITTAGLTYSVVHYIEGENHSLEIKGLKNELVYCKHEKEQCEIRFNDLKDEFDNSPASKNPSVKTISSIKNIQSIEKGGTINNNGTTHIGDNIGEQR